MTIGNRRGTATLAGIAVLAALALGAPGSRAADGPQARAAKTLRGSGGFSVKAPRGYRVGRRGSTYTVSNGRVAFSYARVRGAGSASSAGRGLARALRARITSSSGGASRWRARLSVARRLQVISLRRSGGYLVVLRFRDARAARAASEVPAARAALTGAELAALERIARTARGGAPQTLSDSLPMKQFVAPDGRSRALVPSGPGWQYSGGGGQIIVGNARLGAVSLGLPFFIQYPDSIGQKYPQYPIANYTPDAAAAVEQIFPDYFRRQGSDVRSIRFVRILARPPSALGFAGSGSAVYGVIAVDIAGKPFQGLIYAAVGRDDSIFASYAYTSYLVVPRGVDPRVFVSLMRTWQSWDPSADQRVRLAQTLNTLASINYGGGPIDPEVFDAAAAKWSDYIRS
ncbi:MAG: hypothetical protein U0T02_04310 [Solirubrobacteraceae bacterium]